MKFNLLFTLLTIWSSNLFSSEIKNYLPIYIIDFTTDYTSSPVSWMESLGFEFALDALDIHFERDASLGLKMSTKNNLAGLIGIRFKSNSMIENVDFVEIEWGVIRHPIGANWEKESRRVAIATMFFFGTEKIDSGLPFGINSAPYFISPFIANEEPAYKVYTGNLYKKGGRYLSIPSQPDKAGVTKSRINLKQYFIDSYGSAAVPPISIFAFQMNTKDTSGGAEAFLRKITFYTNKT